MVGIWTAEKLKINGPNNYHMKDTLTPLINLFSVSSCYMKSNFLADIKK